MFIVRREVKKKKCKVCGDLFPVFNSTQTVCSPKCALKLVKKQKEKKKASMYKISGRDIEKLIHKADALYQQVGKKLHPYSILSTEEEPEPTQVIHHRIKKSESNNLRYYLPNGVPLTNIEHDSIHSRGKSVELDIDAKMGNDWTNDLLEKRRIIRKLNKEYLEEVIEELENETN